MSAALFASLQCRLRADNISLSPVEWFIVAIVFLHWWVDVTVLVNHFLVTGLSSRFVSGLLEVELSTSIITLQHAEASYYI